MWCLISRNLRGSVAKTSDISSVECVVMNSEIILNLSCFKYQLCINLNFIVFILINHSREKKILKKTSRTANTVGTPKYLTGITSKRICITTEWCEFIIFSTNLVFPHIFS